jgi:hypothetical protein
MSSTTQEESWWFDSVVSNLRLVSINKRNSIFCCDFLFLFFFFLNKKVRKYARGVEENERERKRKEVLLVSLLCCDSFSILFVPSNTCELAKSRICPTI